MLEAEERSVRKLLLYEGIPKTLGKIQEMNDYQSMPQVCNKAKKVMKEILMYEDYYKKTGL